MGMCQNRHTTDKYLNKGPKVCVYSGEFYLADMCGIVKDLFL